MNISIYIDDNLNELLVKSAQENKMSKSDVIRKALKSFLSAQGLKTEDVLVETRLILLEQEFASLKTKVLSIDKANDKLEQRIEKLER